MNHFINIGIGIDIVEINRFKQRPYSTNQSFYTKIFSEDEIKYCLKFSEPYQHFAGKIALKDAVQKSINENLVLNKIETFHSNSKPKVKLQDSKEKYEFISSISHEKEFAVAVAISEKTI